MLYAVTVALIIGLISTSLVLYAYLNRVEFMDSRLALEAQRNATSGLRLLLAKPESVPFGKPTVVDLFNNGLDKVQMHRQQWGGFEIGIASAERNRHQHTRAAMIGSNLHRDSQVALYLADRNKPLSLCGRTLLKGVCYLPKAGLKRAYIEGQTFVGTKLVQGTVQEAKRQLPAINREMVDQNIGYFKGQYQPTDSVLNSGLLPDTLENSFTEKTLLLEVDGDFPMTSGRYVGNVRVVSNGTVFIGAGAVVEDAIVYAPNVIIEDGFRGRLQVFATDSVDIGEDVLLEYPSVLGLARRPSKEYAQLHVRPGADITGVVFAWQETTGVRNHLKLALDKESIIRGQVYTNGMVDMKGNIYGSLACNGFLLNTPSSVYENHLLNATIDFSRLSEHFTGINLVNESDTREVVKWLY